jgi:hypothetical protein
MNILTSPKKNYLLEAGLDVLHQESTEWLNEIDFWRDEAYFFYTLITNKAWSAVPSASGPLLQKIESELSAITLNDLNRLSEEVSEHEALLGSLIATKFADPSAYRDTHRELGEKFSAFAARFRALKMQVFELVKLVDKK